MFTSMFLATNYGASKLQGNWWERCSIQGVILWDMSLWPSHYEEWMGQNNLSISPRVCFQLL